MPSIKLEEIIAVLEEEIKEKELAIEEAKRAIALHEARIAWNHRVVGWLRSGRDPETAVMPASGDGTFPCPFCPFVSATEKGLTLHTSWKHQDEHQKKYGPTPEPKVQVYSPGHPELAAGHDLRKVPGRTGPLDEQEQARRRAVYDLRLTDRESGERLGMTGQGYALWRKKERLPKWRARGDHEPQKSNR